MGIGSGMAITLSTGGIAENVFDSFIAWISGVIAYALDAFGSTFTDATRPDWTTLTGFFPFMQTFFEIFKYFGFALLILIFVWQLFKAYGGKIVEAEDPLVLTVRTMLFAALVSFSYDIMGFVLGNGTYGGIATIPFDIFSEVDVYEGAQESAMALLADQNNLTFSTFFSAVWGVVSAVPLIIGTICTIVLVWNYLKLLIEVCERYVVLCLLSITSPLAFAMGASRTTSDVFKSWCRMLGSQLFVIVMNVFFLKSFDMMFGYFMAAVTANNPVDNGFVDAINYGDKVMGFFLGYFTLIAFLRIASRFDEILGQLGLNAAKTGGGLMAGGMGMLPMMAGRAALGKFMGGSHGGGMGGAFGSASKTLGVGGIGSIPSRMAGAFKPSTYLGNALGGQKQGFKGLAGIVANAAAKGYVGKNGLGDTSLISGLANSTQKGLNSIGGQAGLNDAQKFMPNLFGKEGLNFDAASQLNSAGQMAGQFTDANGNTFGLVATSMQANEAPNGPFATATAVDGSGFFVQALDKNGNVSEEGMAALFGAPSIGDGEGQIASGAFADTFFPGQDDVTGGLTFSNDESDPFTLNATDADGNTFAFRSGAGYEMPEDAIDGMTITDANGQEWFAQDTTPLDVSDISEGVAIGADGSVTDSFGNEVSDDVLGSVADASDYEGNFTGDLGSGFNDMTVNPDNPYEMSVQPVDPDTGAPLVDSNGDVVDSIPYQNIGDVSALTDEDGTTWVPASEGFVAGEGVQTRMDEDGNTLVAAVTDENGQTWVPAPEGYNPPDVNYSDGEAGWSSSYTDENGNSYAPMYTDDNGQAWIPVANGEEVGTAFDSSTYDATFSPTNPYEANITNTETGESGIYQHSAMGVPEGADKDSAIVDNHGNSWYPVSDSNSFDAQKANIEKSNSSVASYFGFSSEQANNMQYADTSRMKSDGIVDVYNKDGSAQRYVAQKGGEKGGYDVRGDYSEVKSKTGDSWYAINGTRGVSYRDTGKRDEQGNPVTKKVGEAKWGGQLSRKKEAGPESKFAKPKTRGGGRGRKK